MIIKTQSILLLSPCAGAADYILLSYLCSHSQLNNNHAGVEETNDSSHYQGTLYVHTMFF